MRSDANSRAVNWLVNAKDYGTPDLVLDTTGANSLVVPDGDLLLKGDFTRTGEDLWIIDSDGTTVLIRGYFDFPISLQTPSGAVLPADLVAILTASQTPGQYAQINEISDALPIGLVETVKGIATATRADGTVFKLYGGTQVFQGDVIETSNDSALGIVFSDDSTFAFGEASRVVLDEFIFDANSGLGSSSLTILQGIFTFVSGELATNDPGAMVVRTPVAEIGIRGTKVAGRAAQEGEYNTITLMPDNDGEVGQITVSNASGTIALSAAFQTTAVSSVFEAPADPVTLSETQVSVMFSEVDRLLGETSRSYEGRVREKPKETRRDEENETRDNEAQTGKPENSADEDGADVERHVDGLGLEGKKVDEDVENLDSEGKVQNVFPETINKGINEFGIYGDMQQADQYFTEGMEFSESTLAERAFLELEEALNEGDTLASAFSKAEALGIKAFESFVRINDGAYFELSSDPDTKKFDWQPAEWREQRLSYDSGAGSEFPTSLGSDGFLHSILTPPPSVFNLNELGNSLAGNTRFQFDPLLFSVSNQNVLSLIEEESSLTITAVTVGDGSNQLVVVAPTVASRTNVSGFRFDGILSNEESGYSVSGVGDVNGDGFDDVIIGAAFGTEGDANTNQSSRKGAAYIVFGKATGFDSTVSATSLDGTNGFIVVGDSDGDRTGISVSGAGDWNGDGIDDVMVGARYDNGRTGVTYVVFGRKLVADGGPGFSATIIGNNLNSSQLSSSGGIRAFGENSGDESGDSTAPAGDFNGDGIDDMIIGAFKADPGSRGNAGSTYVSFGRASDTGNPFAVSGGENLSGLGTTANPGFRLDGVVSSDNSGISVSSVGDVNGDTFSDIIVGAPGDLQLTVTGTSHVIFGASSTNGFDVSGVGSGNTFDTTIDLSDLDGTAGFDLTGEQTGDRFGFDVRGAGDVNGDGFDDIIIGARYADPNSLGREGAAYVVFGKSSSFGASVSVSTLDGTNGFRIDGAEAGDQLGRTVSGAGDVNGDGFDDVIVGAYGANSGAGSSYVIFGKASGFTASIDVGSLTIPIGFELTGVAGNDFSGSSVDSAGDVNGDGFDDMIIGAKFTDLGGLSNVGASFIVFGANFTGSLSFLGSNTADTLTGTSADENLVAGQGNDTISGGDGRDVIRAGAGDDTLSGNGGSDLLRGGSGSDVFNYLATSEGGSVLTNQTASSAGVVGDRIQDFASGTDKYNFLQSGFPNSSTGALVNGTNFSSISSPFDGTNPGSNANFSSSTGTFIFDSTDTLYFDSNGPSPGYTVIARTNGTDVVAGDIEIVS